MGKNLKFAAIDIGSNALRFAYTDQKSGLIESKKIRIPLRLGPDVFQTGFIQELNFKYGHFVFKNLAKLITHKRIDHLKVYATSALRDAKNGQDFIESMHQESGISIEVIDGTKEAQLTRQLIEYEFSIKKKTYLFLDIGGGSIELNLYLKGVFERSISLNIGTVRMLNSGLDFQKSLDDIWPQVEHFLGDKRDDSMEVLGTGGSFRQIMKIHHSTNPVESYTAKEIKALAKDISNLSLDQRISKYNLKPDRARVVAPALFILNYFLSNLKVKKLHCCRYGLVQAILLEVMKECESKR